MMMNETKPTKTLLRDEQGGLSMARTLLMCQLLYVGALAFAAALNMVSLGAEWWTYNATVSVGLIAWAGGPRGLQYLGPRIGQAAKAVREAATARTTGTDDRFKDDERGPQ